MKANHQNVIPTLNCQNIRELLETAGWQDNPTAAIKQHLSHCLPCQRYGRELLNLRTLIKAQPPVPAPHDFNLKLRQRIAANKAKPSSLSTSHWWQQLNTQPLFTAAMALVILTFVVTGYQYWPTSSSTPLSIGQNPVNAGDKTPITTPTTTKNEMLIANKDEKMTREESTTSIPEKPRRIGGKYLSNINVEIRYPNERQVVPVLQVTYGSQPIVPVKMNETKMGEVIAQGESVIF